MSGDIDIDYEEHFDEFEDYIRLPVLGSRTGADGVKRDDPWTAQDGKPAFAEVWGPYSAQVKKLNLRSAARNAAIKGDATDPKTIAAYEKLLKSVQDTLHLRFRAIGYPSRKTGTIEVVEGTDALEALFDQMPEAILTQLTDMAMNTDRFIKRRSRK